jgi:hypothetical protein
MQQVGMAVFGLLSTVSGSLLWAQSTTQPVTPIGSPWWLGLVLTGVAAMSGIVGHLTAWLTNRRRSFSDDLAKITAANDQFRQDMFKQVGRLEQWSIQQDQKIESLENERQTERELKHKCAQQLQVATLRLDEAKREAEMWKNKAMDLAVKVNAQEMNNGK